MSRLNEHPTVKKMEPRLVDILERRTEPLDAVWLRELVISAGADDVGFVSIDRSELKDQRDELLQLFPSVRTVIPYVVRMHRELIRTPFRSVANHEFHNTGDEVDDVGRRVVSLLEEHGIRALNPPLAFPMEAKRFPDQKAWVISYKPIAVAGGLGQMGIHRNVIHPKFGNFILLGAVLIDADIRDENRAIDYNPCLECKLCVAACPVGAIGADGWFDFNACFTHNYREFLGGFSSWVDALTDSQSADAYHKQFDKGETVSMWQSLAYGPNYKAAYCMAVCPAGEDVISPYLADKGRYLKDIVKPLQNKDETVYVTKGSDAAIHVRKRFPHKTVKEVKNGAGVTTIRGFADNMVHFFQRGKSEGLNTVYHFIFTGATPINMTVTIRNESIRKEDGLQGTANLIIYADGETWVRFLNRKTTGVFAFLTRKIRIQGDPRLLVAFGNCFPF
ncbi:MAG: 4Fe-4S ferredoxin [Anaerolineaceae bacterium]|nr:4Fe-4S ferredoxin [Anaerolineaceae bacterium]